MSDNKQQANKGMQFLKVPYKYFKLIGTYEHDKNKIKIDTLDVLIIAKISELLDFNMDCFISDDGFAELFRTSRSTIQRSIKNLKSLGFIKSDTYITHNTGQQTKHRNLTVNDAVITATINDNGKSSKANIKNSKSTHQNSNKVASKKDKASVNVEAITEKEYKNNIKIKENNYSSSIPDGIKDVMNRIGINYKENTDIEIRKIIGEDLDYTVLARVVEDNKNSFLKRINNGQNYLFGILKAIVKEKYKEYQTKIKIEHAECQEELKHIREEPYIDYSKIASLSKNDHKKDKIDIAALLDEMDAEEESGNENVCNLENDTYDIWEYNEIPYDLNAEGDKIFASPSLQMIYGKNSILKDGCSI